MTPYEAWVHRLRAWVADPIGTRLDDLPLLRADDYNRQTMTRFATHLDTALRESMDRWQRTLENNVSQATSTHDLSSALIRLRTGLARQFRLTQHPGLPPELRRIFGEQMTRSIERLQQQLEQAFGHDDGRSTSNRAQRDQLLRMVREAPLTGAIGLAAGPDAPERPAPAPLAVPPLSAVPPNAANVAPPRSVPTRRHRLVSPVQPLEPQQ